MSKRDFEQGEGLSIFINDNINSLFLIDGDLHKILKEILYIISR